MAPEDEADAQGARIAEAHRHRRGYYQVRPGDVLAHMDMLFLDVRYEEDLDKDMGHIHGVCSLPLAQLERYAEAKERPVIVVCGNGRESVRAAERLASEGYSEVYHLVGGMLRWTAEHRPVAKKTTWTRYGESG